MKKLLAASFLFLSLLFLSACSKNNNDVKELSSADNLKNYSEEVESNVVKNNNEVENSPVEAKNNWQSFKSSDYFFEFNYPVNSLKTETLFGEEIVMPKWENGVVVKETTSSDKYSLNIKSYDTSTEAYYFNALVYPNTNKKWSDIKNNVLCKPENTDVVCEIVKINNLIDAYKVTVNSTQAVPGSDYYFIYKGNYYIVQHSIKPSYNSNINDFGEEIMKTLFLF